MFGIPTQIQSIEASPQLDLQLLLAQQTEPLVIRGLVNHWPLVQQSKVSDQSVDQYLRHYSAKVPVQAFYAPAESNSRFFYNDDMTGLNFRQVPTQLEQVLDHIEQHMGQNTAPCFYMGSTTLDYCLPGLREQNDLPLSELKPLISIWLGNASKVSAHYDVPDNIACVAAGTRRFALFPPAQLPNLYVGPFELTPAGQPVSLVNIAEPDLIRHPKFSQALLQAQWAELQAGDAIFIPSLWWHYVESLSSLNILINYWWRSTPAYTGQPMDALQHAILTIRDLPAHQRAAWLQHFQHYVFAADEQSSAHIPIQAKGLQGPIDQTQARKTRAMLLNKLNR
jgi:hypothetical protein